MTAPVSRLQEALAGRYGIAREIGQGGMATVYGSGMLMAAEFRSAPSFSVFARDTVFTDTYMFATNPHANYDVLPDGAHFVFLESDHSGAMIVVSNWRSVLHAHMAGVEGR